MFLTLLRESHLVLLCLLSFVLFVPVSAQTDGEWHYQTLQGEEGRKRADASFVRVGEYGYLLGGTGDLPIQRYDPRTQMWSSMTTTLDNIHHFQAQVYGGKIYILGAFQGHYLAEYPHRAIYSYDPATDVLREIGSMPAGRERGSAGMVVYGGKLYLVGGNRAGHRARTQNGNQIGPVAWVDSYDPATGQWEVLPDAPHARDHFKAVEANGKLYAAGGGRSQYEGSAGLYGDLEPAVDVFDFSAKQWLSGSQAPAALPQPTTSAASAIVDGTLVVSGGVTSNDGIATTATSLLDLSTGTWRQGRAMIKGRQAAATAVFGSRMYVASGAVADPRSRIGGGDVYVEFFSLADEPVKRYDGWVEIGQSEHPRAEGQMVTYEGEYYHFNGFDNGLALQATNEKYNPTTNTWTTLAPHPKGPNGEEIAATHTGIALVGDVVWIAGGRIGSHPGRVTSGVYLYDISDDSWSEGPALPVRIGAGGLARLGRKLHWVGGFDEKAECDVDDHWVYDLDDPSAGWQDYSATSPMPEARNHFGTVVLGGKLYAVAGQFGHDGCKMGKNQRFLHVYDPLTDKWTRLADLPGDQSHTEPSTFAYNKKIYSIGGQGLQSAEVWEYDPPTDRWTVRTDLEMPLRLIAPGARVSAEHLYVMIGGKVAVNHPQTEVRKTYFGPLTTQELAFYPASLNVSGDATSTSEALLVNYSGEDEVAYRVDTEALPAWLTLDRSNGTARESFEEVRVAVDPKGLPKGDYSYLLRATADGYQAGELRIAFSVTTEQDEDSDEDDEDTDEDEDEDDDDKEDDDDDEVPSDSEKPEPPVDPTPSPEPTPTPKPTDPVSEVECGTYGSAWVMMEDATASGGVYLTPAAGRVAKSAAPADRPENLIRLILDVPVAGSYHLMVRALATNGGDDSFYFRVNGGDWVTWGSGLQSKGQFTWQRYPSLFQLPAGTTVVELTYREPGLRLDKLLLTLDAELPSGTGPATAACDIPEEEPDAPTACGGAPCDTDIWLEAECAANQGDWRQARDPAKTVDYLIFAGRSNYGAPMTTTEDAITFVFDVVESGTYYPNFRLDAPTNSKNSFWVQLDEGPWLRFWRNADGSNMLTTGFAWKQLTDDTKPVVFELSAGTHTLTVANRESGTALDKVVLTRQAGLPTGVGTPGTNCQTASATASLGAFGAADRLDEADATQPIELALYPNPVGTELTVALSAVQQEVRIRITDVHGRQVRQLSVPTAAGAYRQFIDVSGLPQGMYRLEVRTGEQYRIATFVKGR